jgi:hypothetical protein
LIAFKYLDGDVSPYQNFKYEIGKEYSVEDGDSDDRILCEKGINLASLEWCLRETHCDLTKTYAIFEFDPKDILSIPYNSDGKFRVSKARYVRNLTENEVKKAVEPLYPSPKSQIPLNPESFGSMTGSKSESSESLNLDNLGVSTHILERWSGELAEAV